VWSDIRKTADELKLGHPAMFPEMLVQRLLSCFTRSDERVVLDPFMGSGSTIIAAYHAGKKGIGFEVSKEYIKLARTRLEQGFLNFHGAPAEQALPEILHEDARELASIITEPVDICITSPPYWDILEQKRTADGKPIRNYGDEKADLGKIAHYEAFLDELDKVWRPVHTVLKPGGYLVIVVMDIRKAGQFYPFHMDITRHVTGVGQPPLELDDMIIWNRQQEYNNLRPLGYPYTFRVNKIHEFILIFRKPK